MVADESLVLIVDLAHELGELREVDRGVKIVVFQQSPGDEWHYVLPAYFCVELEDVELEGVDLLVVLLVALD